MSDMAPAKRQGMAGQITWQESEPGMECPHVNQCLIRDPQNAQYELECVDCGLTHYISLDDWLYGGSIRLSR